MPSNLDEVLGSAKSAKGKAAINKAPQGKKRKQSQPQLSSEDTTIKLSDISDRDSNTRDLQIDHAQQLMQSIHDIGIIHPVVVDQTGVLLAGGHRLLALQMLQNHHKDRFFEWFPDGKIPVRKMPFTVESNPDWALDIEISENNVREDYTPDEVWAIAERLRAAGYEDTPGKPKAGEKRLRPALMTITGKSERSIRRYLNNREKRKNETRPSDRVSESDRHLQRAIASLEKWKGSKGRKNREKDLAKDIDGILEQLRTGLGE